MSSKGKQSSFNPACFTDALHGRYFSKKRKNRKNQQRQRENLVDWLRKKHKSNISAQILADKLENCASKSRCQSPACPECGAAGQRLIATATRRFLKHHAGGSAKIVCVTIVPTDGRIKRGKLNKADHERAIRRWKEKLGKAGITWFIGATDISLNEHKQNRYKRHWSEHIYGITATKDPKKLKTELRKQFPKNKAIPRPVKVREWDGNKKALRYILKPNFWRRIASDNGQRHNKKTGIARTCCTTRKARLRSKERRELFVYLDKIGMQARLLMRWCQLLNSKSSGPSIMLRVPK
ncbi:MAG: hypothetical protein WAM62_09690 [Pseudolabrys sp.]